MPSVCQYVGVSFATLSVVGGLIGVATVGPAIAQTRALSNGALCEGRFDAAGNSPDAVCNLPPVAEREPECSARDRGDEDAFSSVIGSPYTYYRGPIVRLVPQGRGVFVWYCRDTQANRDRFDRFEGNVRNGRPNGQGLYLFSNNDRYQGGFRNGLFHGKGVLRYGRSVYNGEFINGLFGGRGTLDYGNGDRFVGSFRNGFPHGQGTLKFGNRTYSGEFHQGQINGQGTIVNEDGSRCTGQFFTGLLEGRGNCTFPTGIYRTYSGELRNGRPDGKGRATLRNGTTQVGLFRNGQYVGP